MRDVVRISAYQKSLQPNQPRNDFRCSNRNPAVIAFPNAFQLRLDHWLHFAWVVDDAKCIVVTHVCVSVCLSAAACPHYCTDPDVTGGSGRGCPLVVHYWTDLQSVYRLRCYGNITRTLVTSLFPSREGITNYHIGPHRTTSDYVGPHH